MDQKVRIVGGGFSGLVQAFYLIQWGFKPVIFEKKKNLGGLIASHHLPSGLVEQAAGSFLANAELERLSRTLGVCLVPTLKRGSKKFIYRNNKKCRWPLSPGESFSLLLKILFKGGLKRTLRDIREGETLGQWGRRCLGSSAVRFILEPAMQGIYALGSDQLSAHLVLNSLLNRSPKGFYRGSVAPKKGMGEWMTAMRSYLKSNGCEFVTHCEIDRKKDKDFTFWAVDLASLKEIGKKQKDWPIPEINKTRTTGLSSLTLIFENQNLQPEGFGCLFPGGFGFNSLGVLFNHNIFEGRAVERGSSETWIFGDSFVLEEFCGDEEGRRISHPWNGGQEESRGDEEFCGDYGRQFVNFSGMDKEKLISCVLSDRHRLTGVDTVFESTASKLKDDNRLAGTDIVCNKTDRGGSAFFKNPYRAKTFQNSSDWNHSFLESGGSSEKKRTPGIKIFQWPDCLPVYDENLKRFIEALDQKKAGEDFFIGNYLGQLGLSEIVTRAKTNAEKFKNLRTPS